MVLKYRVRHLEKTKSQGDREIISACSKEELAKKVADYKRKNPYSPDPHEILIIRTIIKSRDDLEKPEL